MRRWLSALGLGLLSGCASDGVGLSYYWQAVRGQWDLRQRAEPVEALLARADTPEVLRARLQLTQEIRAFAVRELGLPDNDSYRQYADLQRRAVVWNVFAAPPLSLRAETWCFPVAGCVGYLGFFSEAAARERAAALRARGLDVHVGAVPAYSTLGWFADPLLNTFIDWPEVELARLIFHELAHQLLYVKDDTEFNESFASTVELVGVRRWLARPDKAALREGFEAGRARQADFAALVMDYRARFEALYAEAAGAGEGSQAEFLARKAALFEALRADYRTMRDTRWAGYAGYDGWFANLNNAQLAAVGFYQGLVPGFEALLAKEQGDLSRWYARVAELAARPLPERRAALAARLP